MKLSQWVTFGIIFLLISIYFFFWDMITSSYTILSVNSISTGLAFLLNRLYAFLYLIFFGLGIAFLICAWLEKKKG